MKTKFYFNDLNDTQKQELANKMLRDQTVVLQNELVEFVLSCEFSDFSDNVPFTRDDITNFEPTGSISLNGEWVELTEEEREEKEEFYQYLSDKADQVMEALEEQQGETTTDQEYDLIEEKIEKWQDVQTKYNDQLSELKNLYCDEYPEIYQWFYCSDWLLRKLENHSECTLDGQFWGRQACGQSIVLDTVIQKIAFNYACGYDKDYLTKDQIDNL